MCRHGWLRFVATGSLLLGLPLLGTIGCGGGGGDPISRRAAEVYDQYVAESDDYLVYALSLAPASRSERARRLVIESIGSPARGIAMEAIHGIGETPDEETREAVRSVFTQKSGALKLSAALALAEAGDADAQAWLRGQLDESGVLLGADAFRVLAQAGEQEALESVLRKRIGSDDPSIRNEAYRILGEIHEVWAVGVLLEGLGQEHGESRLEPILALGRSGIPDVAPHLERFINTRGLVLPTIEALGALGNPKSVGPLEKLIDHDEPHVVAYAGTALWRLGQAEVAQPALDPLRTHEDPGVRRTLVEQLSLLPDGAADAWLAELASDEDKDVQIAALRALADHRSPEAIAASAAAAADEDYEVATLALNLLAAGGGAEHRETLAPLLESPNPYVALSAADAVLAIDHRTGGESPA